MALAIEARGLTKTYRKGVRALDSLSFSTEAGRLFALLGPNGAGKTTAVRILTTLSRPDEGQALVDGIDVLAHPARVRRIIGVVGQRPASVRGLTGRENLQLQANLYGIDQREARIRCDQLLGAMGLRGAGDRLVNTYSGGMLRRLDIAIGLVNRPRVLFLDEPTTGLDPEARAATWQTLNALAKEEGVSMLLTTHYLEEADHFAAFVAIVDRGRVVVEGTPESLKAGLGGDSVQVALSTLDAARGAADVLSLEYGSEAVTIDGHAVHVRVREGARELPVLLGAIGSHGFGVEAVTVAGPSLDDVYLRHTGRSFRTAEQEVAA